MGCLFDSSFLDLEIINNVRFSLREVDIVSCIVNGRSSKFIARLLDISPKTVEAHIRNIKIKMNCSSKEQMVSFIEKSNKYQLISQHYRDLIVNVEFEKSLQNISLEITNKSIELQMICLIKNNNEEDIKCCKLVKHLFMAGIKANLECKDLNELDFKANRYVLLCSAQTAREICNQYKEQVKNIVFFTNEPLDIEQKSQIISSTTPNNYYSSVLELIGKFYSSEQVESLISKFRSFYEGNSSEFYINNQIARSKYSWNKHKILIASCLILILLTCFFLHFYASTRSKSINMYTQFIGKDILLPRKNLIHEINEVFEKQSGIKYAILVGEGGMGKTVISRHYLQLNNFKIKAEMNAETHNSLSDSFANLAITLANTKELQERLSYIRAITDCKRRNKQVFLFVLSQLREVGNWCLLFDNVDDFNLIRDFIPINDGTYNNGKVIITTRNENFKNVTIFPRFCAINVPLLTVNEQEELFSKITCGKDKRNEAVEQSVLKNFLKNIPSMPLDVCAAAFYIKNTRISFGEYLRLSKNPCQSIEKIQSNFLAEGINYDKTRYGIISSVFEKIIKTNADFKELLLFICLLDSQNIPKAYLEKCKDHAVVQDFIHNLRKYSLITEKNGTFSIHRSTQEIGLKYILSRLSEDEKIRFLDDIVNIMSPYQNIKSYTKTNPSRVLTHLNSLLNKIQNSFKFSYAQKGLIAKLSLTIGYIYKIDDVNSILAKDFFISAINNAPSENFINKKELATIYMFLGGLLADSDKRSLEKGIEYAKKSMSLFDGIQNSERYLITNLRYLSNAYTQKNDFNKAKSYLGKALSIAYTIKNEKERNINLAYIYKYMSSLYLKTGKTKENLKTSRALMEKALLLLKSKEFFYKSHKRPREFLHSVSCKRRLGKLCNHMELYQEALEHLKDAEYLINLAPHDTNNYHVMLGIIFCEQGISLLRLNSLQEAERLLKKSLKMLESTEHYNSIIRIKLVLIEDLIRLGKLNEAYEVCQYIFSIKDIEDNNYTVMLYNTCYYNAAIIQYKLFHLPQAITYFQKFFELSKGFCKTFLSEKVYQELVAENVFEKVENTSEIDKCLQNSLKIFTAIYGEKHSFIENYVKKTLSKP